MKPVFTVYGASLRKMEMVKPPAFSDSSNGENNDEVTVDKETRIQLKCEEVAKAVKHFCSHSLSAENLQECKNFAENCPGILENKD